MRRLTTTVLATLIVGGLALGATGCDDDTTSSRSKESKARNGNYDQLVSRQPAHTGSYSPTRETKNFWIDTWMKSPNKLSYVYIQNANGDYGYFILKGLPVTYCVSLLPPEVKADLDLGGNDGEQFVQGPSMDGTYSSGSNCNAYYGKDATTGAYVEFSVGQNQSYFLYDRPLDLPQFEGAKPMGPSRIEDVKDSKS
ncbi:putative secreted phage-encoded protein [Streptomyces scabiei 87.22]|uniref:Putative secreted phage-encoded protein n=1 Tax=Streptomyces scabiei (strain 87.22) TaxID=680198 RepID=C9Z8Z4_STRSW|nr:MULTISPECIES: hypothetical protein [Streptomyces]MBP5875707.1 hypothetical protein [Streptomyces sp. LBUM 1477]MDX2652166.1 hypothetical protein [Streptomyces scabiei]MDX2725808.1 hypothetical protein [Streptomyces scabiei]MDX2863927.1 hypothetical protein [Streptomyces scabiei]MDX2881851.1 hypothetical protein [Streptomyces scabiei]